MAASATNGFEDRVDAHGRPIGGFGFENVLRNQMLQKSSGLKLPGAHKTGTTIAGLIYKDGVILGADTRATSGPTICDKNCEKIHYIAPNIWCCGAGTSADTENVTEMISQQLSLLRMTTGTKSRVVTAMTRLKHHLFRYQGYISAYLVIGGVDCTGPHLYTVWAHGSTDKLPFVTMGSGSYAAMSIFEAGYKDDMTEEEAKKLVHRAIRAGIFNDLGSGNNVDLMVLRTDGTSEMLRNYEKPNEASALRAQVTRPSKFTIPAGATGVLSTEKVEVAETKEEKADAMDVSK